MVKRVSIAALYVGSLTMGDLGVPRVTSMQDCIGAKHADRDIARLIPTYQKWPVRSRNQESTPNLGPESMERAAI
jgi:hypothetical protein